MTPTDPRPTDAFDRRRFLALGAGLTVLAGCSSGPTDGSGGGNGGDGGGGSNGDQPAGPTAESTGAFRLLISDQPSAIGDFDSLVVTLSEARVFGPRGAGDESEDGDDGDEEGTSEETTTATETTEETTTTTTDESSTETTEETTTTTTEETTTETTTSGDGSSDDDGEEADEDGEDDDGERGFSVLDLGGATVDLTTVVGEKATGVFDGELPEGRYTKVELHVTQVDGVVEGDEVDVKLPSEKLQITKNFEVVAGETLSFVFDITVVRKGNGGYNLLPVISESGVAGEDVQVEEVGPGSQGGEEGESAEGDGDGSPEAGEGGPPETNPGQAGGSGGPPDG